MALIEVDRNPSRRVLRQFGLLCLAFFGALGGYYYWQGATTSPYVLAALAAAGGALGLLAPQALRWVFVGWCYAVLPIGWVVSHVLLFLIYYFVLLPTGLLMRIVGYDPLMRKLDPEAKSYWIPVEPAVGTQSYFRQF